MASSRSSFPMCLALLVAACSSDPGPGSTGPVDTSSSSAPSSPSEPAPGLTLTVDVEGTGAVRSEPAGIDCPGSACTATFPPSTRVTLVATPAEGWRLSKWKGDCTGDGECVIDLEADAVVTGALSLIDPRWDPALGAGDCADAWGTSGEKLSACDTVRDDYVVVRKAKRNVALCKSGKLVKNLRAGLGFAPSGDKVKQGDGKTPEGVFYIPRLVPNSSYYKAFLISYPTVDDASRGVASGLITNAQASQIKSAHASCAEPPQNTGLGGEVEIHGNGSTADWTAGCVAVEDEDLDLLWSALGVGDTIVVLP